MVQSKHHGGYNKVEKIRVRQGSQCLSKVTWTESASRSDLGLRERDMMLLHRFFVKP